MTRALVSSVLTSARISELRVLRDAGAVSLVRSAWRTVPEDEMRTNDTKITFLMCSICRPHRF
jgi:hypothetical protein